MFYNILKVLLCSGLLLLGICALVHICAKHKYSFKYESTKRKFEIYPNKDRPRKSQNNLD